MFAISSTWAFASTCRAYDSNINDLKTESKVLTERIKTLETNYTKIEIKLDKIDTKLGDISETLAKLGK